MSKRAKPKLLLSRKAALDDKLSATPDAEPLLHPALPIIYRDTVETLEAWLRQPETGREALEPTRSLIDNSTLTPWTAPVLSENHIRTYR